MATLANNLAFHTVAVTASSQGTNPNYVLDGGSTQWSSVSNGLPAWLQFKLDRPIPMSSYAILPNNASYAPKDWTFSGSDDGTTWTQLDSRTGQTFATTSTWNTYTFANTTAYLYYRFTFTAVFSSTATQVWIGEVELGGTVPNDITHNIIETVVSGVYSTGTAAANLYDRSVASNKGWVSNSSTSPWVRVKLDQRLALTNYTLWPDPNPLINKPPTAWTVSGSDDGVAWTPIDSRSTQTWSFHTGALGKPNTYTLANQQGFLYYRFDFPSPTGSSFFVYLQELELVGQPGQPGFVNVPSADTRLTVPYWNDNFADAAPVVISTASTPFTSPSRSNFGHTTETGEPGSMYRSMWWSYRPLVSGSATFDTQLTAGYQDTRLFIYTGSAVNALTQVAVDDNSGGNQTSMLTYTVTAGTTYYIRVASYSSSTDSNYVLRVNGPVSKSQQQVDAPVMQLKVLVEDGPRVYTDSPPAEVEVSSGAGVPPKNLNDIPPVEVEVSSDGTIPSKNLNDIPPVEVEVSASGGPSATVASPAMNLAAYLGKPTVTRVFRALLDPADSAVVPSVRPVLSVTIRVTEGTVATLRLDVQYDDNAEFSDPTTLTRDVNVVVGENIVRVITLADVPALTSQFWRARLTFLGHIFDWTPASQFTVDPTAGDHRAAITWSVTDGLTDPHLWFVTPAAGKPGDLVTVVGQGFSVEQGTVTLAGTPMPIQSWEHVPASAAAATADRVISLTTVDPEHDHVVVAVPDVSPPGGPLAVTGS